MFNKTISRIGLLLLISLMSCQPMSSGYNQPPAYNDHYPRSYDRPNYDSDYYRRERRDDRERDRREMARERERLEHERRKFEHERSRNQEHDRRPPPPRVESCPSGFHPGGHRCSKADRRRGCKDMKMPGGTTCNAGPFS